MKERKIITSKYGPEIWEQVGNDFINEGVHDYHARIHFEGKDIDIDISSSPGGGTEGGYGATTIAAALPSHSSFQFSITPEDVINRIGKIFGMQDIKVGYPEFDSSVIIKSNDPAKVKTVFDDDYVRTVFQQLSGFNFGIKKHPELEYDQLEIEIQRAISNIDELETIVTAFTKVLNTIHA
jgi:hypothetical protein